MEEDRDIRTCLLHEPATGGESQSEPLLHDDEIDVEEGIQIVPNQGFDNSEEKFCRICLESDFSSENPLIAPCKCKGSSKYVHRSCLDTWRSTKRDTAWSKCTTCLHPYVILKKEPQSMTTAGMWAKMVALVTRDFAFVFLLVQFILGMLTALLMLIDAHGLSKGDIVWGYFAKCGRDEPTSRRDDNYFCEHQVAAYYLSSLILIILVSGICAIPRAYSYILSTNSNLLFYSCYCVDFLPALVLMLIIFLLIGIVYAAISAIVYLQTIVQNHMHIIHKKALAEEFYVADLDEVNNVKEEEGKDDESTVGNPLPPADASSNTNDSFGRINSMSSRDRDYLLRIGLL